MSPTFSAVRDARSASACQLASSLLETFAGPPPIIYSSPELKATGVCRQSNGWRFPTFDRRRSSAVVQNSEFTEDASGTHRCQQLAELADLDRSLWTLGLSREAELLLLTFHDVDEIAHVTLLDNEAAIGMFKRVHTVDDGHDLIHFEILHEVVVENGIAKVLLGSGRRETRSIERVVRREG